MKIRLSWLLILTCFIPNNINAQNKYTGVKSCISCHRGSIASIWEKSKHASAYKTLQTEAAQKIAEEKGLIKAAYESPECLECHITAANADTALLKRGYNKKDGVTCEACHTPGTFHKSKGTTKKKKPTETQCKTCHNKNSPTFKGFKYKEAWMMVKHQMPK